MSFAVRGQPCGGVIRNTTGTLSAIDRDGDGYYDSGMNCMWFVHAPINDYISVQVLFMDILLSDNCQMDFLEVCYSGIKQLKAISWSL